MVTRRKYEHAKDLGLEHRCEAYLLHDNQIIDIPSAYSNQKSSFQRQFGRSIPFDPATDTLFFINDRALHLFAKTVHGDLSGDENKKKVRKIIVAGGDVTLRTMEILHATCPYLREIIFETSSGTDEFSRKEYLWNHVLNPTTAKIVFESSEKIREKIGFDCEAEEWKALKANDGKWIFVTADMVRRMDASKANDIPIREYSIEDYPFRPTLSFSEMLKHE